MKKHLKRLAAPATWKIPRKTFKFVVKPSPGPHAKERCLPLLIVVRDFIKLTRYAREAKKAIKKGEILVDGAKRKDYKFPVGLMDIIEIPKIKKFYRVSIDRRGRISLVETNENERNLKICKINNKTYVKGGRIQLNLHDGRNILVDKDTYEKNSSLLITVPDQKIKKYLPLKQGMTAFVLGGKYKGQIARIAEIREKEIVLKNERNESFIAPVEKIIVVGEDKPELKVL